MSEESRKHNSHAAESWRELAGDVRQWADGHRLAITATVALVVPARGLRAARDTAVCPARRTLPVAIARHRGARAPTAADVATRAVVHSLRPSHTHGAASALPQRG